MYTRRDLLKSTAVGTALGAGALATSSSATAEGAPFGDGVNLQPSYFCSGDQDLGWDLMGEYPGIQSVRIEIEPPSGGESQATIEDAKRWIDEAASHGYQVVATYHHWPDNGSPDASALQNAADFWAEHYDYLSRDADFVMNLMNEWGDHTVSADQYASAYDRAIDTVRNQAGYSGPIVCDAPGWGQETHRLATAVESIDDDDLILSAHVYGDGWNKEVGENLQPSHLDVMDQTDYPCMIGEFGANRDGPVDWSAVVDHASELGWPVFAWAWNGDGSEQPMNMASPYWGNDCGADEYATSSYFDVVYPKLEGVEESTPTETVTETPTDSEDPPAIDGAQPTDPDGDGKYEDLSGNGETDPADVVTLFEEKNSPEVAEYPEYYDFSGNGGVEVADVVQLFGEL